MRIFYLLIASLWIVWTIYWWTSALRAKRNVRNTGWYWNIGIRIIIIIIVLIFLHVPILYHFALHTHSKSFYTNPLTGVIGIIIALFGFALSIWARVCLGRNWGMPMATKEKPELITSGPYKFIRHPIYTGMIVAMIGTTIVTTILWLIPLIFVLGYFIYSSKIEEKNMLKQFPKEYKEYMKQTKALIPFIY